MKVVDNTRKVRFGALSPGDCFYKDDQLYMVATTTARVIGIESDLPGKLNAVSLSDGVLVSLNKSTEVEPCKAEVVVISRCKYSEVLA